MKKRRKFTPEFKAQVTLEVLMGIKNSAEVCREHSLKPEILSRWKAELVENAHLVFRSDEQCIACDSFPQYNKRWFGDSDCDWHRGRQVNDEDAKVAWVTTPVGPVQKQWICWPQPVHCAQR